MEKKEKGIEVVSAEWVEMVRNCGAQVCTSKLPAVYTHLIEREVGKEEKEKGEEEKK